jgi:hypothetical protein
MYDGKVSNLAITTYSLTNLDSASKPETRLLRKREGTIKMMAECRLQSVSSDKDGQFPPYLGQVTTKRVSDPSSSKKLEDQKSGIQDPRTWKKQLINFFYLIEGAIYYLSPGLDHKLSFIESSKFS